MGVHGGGEAAEGRIRSKICSEILSSQSYLKKILLKVAIGWGRECNYA